MRITGLDGMAVSGTNNSGAYSQRPACPGTFPQARSHPLAWQWFCGALPTFEDALHLGEHEWSTGPVDPPAVLQLRDDVAVAEPLIS